MSLKNLISPLRRRMNFLCGLDVGAKCVKMKCGTKCNMVTSLWEKYENRDSNFIATYHKIYKF